MMIATAAEQGVVGDLTVNLVATVVGVFVALSVERAVERWKERKEKLARMSEWLLMIKKGAEASLGHVRQTLRDELLKGAIPTYPHDQTLAIAYSQGAAKDLIEIPGFVDAHRHTVFEMAHLANKINILLTTQHQTVLAQQFAFTIDIAKNAESALQNLLVQCEQALRALPMQLHDS
ncbi:MAG: hypothetical protein JNK15_16350 [Planctomycetes bacterium]|nr:hypothetical protein [Planctomycetota bacterium]